MSKETLDKLRLVKEDQLAAYQKLLISVNHQALSGSLDFAFIRFGRKTNLLFMIENHWCARFFAEILTRPEIRINELNHGDNPFELILDYPSLSAKNVCRQIPSFAWFHYPDATGVQINVFGSLNAFRAQKPMATVNN